MNDSTLRVLSLMMFVVGGVLVGHALLAGTSLIAMGLLTTFTLLRNGRKR